MTQTTSNGHFTKNPSISSDLDLCRFQRIIKVHGDILLNIAII